MATDRLKTVEANNNCFVCGPNNPIGLKTVFRVDNERSTSWTRIRLPAQFEGWQGVVHGGVLAALLDEACIYACRSRASECVTAELQIRYRKPIPVDSEVEVCGELISSDRKLWEAVAQLKIDATLHAEARAKIYILNQ